MTHWLFTMAWRDSRRNQSRLLLFISSIILGIAALVAINSFGDSMQRDIESEAKKLLGADLEVESRAPFNDQQKALFDSLGGIQSKEISFASMVLFPKNGGTRLVQVKALEGDYPYYGAIETEPVLAGQDFRNRKAAIVDNTLLLQFNTAVGDSIKVGEITFPVVGRISKVPGQTGISTTVAPPVYIPMQYLEQTNLLQKGSRINYKTYFKFDAGVDVERMMEKMESSFRQEDLRFDTVEERKNEIGDTYENLTGFLNLVAFVALLLGCVGVASSVHIYIKEKLLSVAILRCLGAKGKQTFAIFLIQIATMGLLGSIIGAILGSVIQYFLPIIFSDFLPVAVSLSISWRAIFEGILIGLFISVLFALLPLLSVRKVSPLAIFRTSAEVETGKEDVVKYGVYLAILLLIGGFAFLQLRNFKDTLFFTGGVLLAFFILAGVAKGMMWLVRKFFPVSWSFIWRQSLANLYRPNNQTLILIVAIGLGTALISTLYFVQRTLLSEVEISGSNNQPNMVLFDIQTNQVNQVASITEQFGLPLIQQVPIVTMRLTSIRNQTVEAIKKDTSSRVSRWVLNREYRVTYRDSLIDSEEITKGKWIPTANSGGDSIFVSLEEGLANSMQVDIGDPVSFNVQGVILKTFVGSFRNVDWRRIQTNFLVLFPTGVLENAPKFHVIITKVNSDQVAANFQQAVVKAFPNVSIIDLKLILKTVDEILGKISFVIQFMALFSMITGLIVLIGSVILSKYQRIQESVLLRTLGASRKQILSMATLEYFFLGSLASLTGVLIGLAGSFGLAKFSFEINFTPAWAPLLVTYLIITGLTIIIGIATSRSVLNKPPLEILRKEV